MTRVGFIGLGAMGAPMAANLAARQFHVTGYDLRPGAGTALAAAGGHEADSAAEACRDADVIVLMVVNAAQARAVLFEGGALAAARNGAIVILMATCPPGEALALANEVEHDGCTLIDAPVSGGITGARDATLTIMASGADAAIAQARPILEAMGDKLFHVGPTPGQGAAVKMVNQLICGINLAAAAEGLAFATRSGVDPALALRILLGSAAGSWMLAQRGPRMLEAHPQVASAVDIFVKDLGIVLDAGRTATSALPLAAAAHQMFLAASAMGHGREDDSQVIKVYRTLMGFAHDPDTTLRPTMESDPA